MPSTLHPASDSISSARSRRRSAAAASSLRGGSHNAGLPHHDYVTHYASVVFVVVVPRVRIIPRPPTTTARHTSRVPRPPPSPRHGKSTNTPVSAPSSYHPTLSFVFVSLLRSSPHSFSFLSLSPSLLCPCAAQQFFHFFQTLVGKPVVVELKNELALKGTLHSVDQYLNIKLDNMSVVDADKHPHLLAVSELLHSRLRRALHTAAGRSRRHAAAAGHSQESQPRAAARQVTAPRRT